MLNSLRAPPVRQRIRLADLLETDTYYSDPDLQFEHFNAYYYAEPIVHVPKVVSHRGRHHAEADRIANIHVPHAKEEAGHVPKLVQQECPRHCCVEEGADVVMKQWVKELVHGPMIQHKETIVQNPVGMDMEVSRPQVVAKNTERPKIQIEDTTIKVPKVIQTVVGKAGQHQVQTIEAEKAKNVTRTVQRVTPIAQEHITHVPKIIKQQVPVEKVLQKAVEVPQLQYTGGPRPPPSAYFIFVQETRRTLPPGEIGEVAKQLVEIWSKRAPEEKAEFERRAEERRQQYEKEMAEYKVKKMIKEAERFADEDKKKKVTGPHGQRRIMGTSEIDPYSFLHVGVEDKDTVKSEKIAIASDTGHRTKMQVERMIKEAERFADEDKKKVKGPRCPLPSVETTEVDPNDFPQVGAKGKGTVRSEKIAVANDKGHRTEMQIEKMMIKEFERFADEDKKKKKKVKGPRGPLQNEGAFEIDVNGILDAGGGIRRDQALEAGRPQLGQALEAGRWAEWRHWNAAGRTREEVRADAENAWLQRLDAAGRRPASCAGLSWGKGRGG